MTLDQLQVGKCCTVSRSTSEQVRAMGLRPGVKVQCVGRCYGVCVLEVGSRMDGYRMCMDREIASEVVVDGVSQ